MTIGSRDPLAPVCVSGRRNGIVAGRTERVAARQPPERQPAASKDAVALDRFRGVVGARRQEPAGPRKIWRNAAAYSALSSASARATRDGGVRVKVVAIIGFKGGQAGVEQLALRHDDDVEAWRDLVSTENLSNQSFSSVSLNRAAELLRRRDAQPADRAAGWRGRTGCVAAVDPDAAFVNLLKLGAARGCARAAGTEANALSRC